MILAFCSGFPLDKRNIKAYNDSYQKFAIAHQKRNEKHDTTRTL